MKRLLVTAASVAVLVCAAASGALAGEVKGPSGTPCDKSVAGDCVHNTNTTGALDHANSACAASGLNDMDPNDPVGQTVSKVQTAADSWKYYGLRTVHQASSDSAGAEPASGELRVAPATQVGPTSFGVVSGGLPRKLSAGPCSPPCRTTWRRARLEARDDEQRDEDDGGGRDLVPGHAQDGLESPSSTPTVESTRPKM